MRALLSGTSLIFRFHLAELLTSRRTLFALLLAAAPAVIAYFPAREGEDALSVVAVVGAMMFLVVIAPLVGLLLGSGVITEEVENRTITYVVTRPVPRAALFVGRLTATVVVTSLFLAAGAVAVTRVATHPQPRDARGRTHVEWVSPDGETLRGRRARFEAVESRTVTDPISRELPEGMVPRFALAAALAGALYSLLAATLGVFLKRPMIVGLGYAFAIEAFVSLVPGSMQKLSMQYYLRSILANLREPPHEGFWQQMPMFARVTFLSPTEAAVRLAVVLLLGLLVGAWAIRRRQFLVTS